METNASQLAEVLAAQPEGRSEIEPGPDTIQNAAKLIMKGADRIHGGFGGAPKFPTPTNLEFLITALDFLPHEEASDYARFLAFTAREMARRGLFDQLGGGFHRYCTDPQWTIPHFEKMLYDQGQMISFYAELVRRAHDASDLLWPIQETVAYLRREMRGEGGAFFASQDADSEGVEGKFFVWTPGQIANVLGDEADPFCTYYGVRLAGNFEDGTTHLIDEARAPREELQAAREILRGVREERIAPETDRKHVAAWNGYVISGLARAAAALEDDTLRRDAVQAADFVLQEMVDEDGRLLRVHNEGQAHTLAFLDDHASLLAAFLDLYRAGGGDRFLAAAQWIAQETLSRFADRDRGVLYLSPTGGPGDRLIHRPRSEQDGATPDAAGLAVLGLARLAALSEDAETAAFVDRALEERGLALEQAPHAFPTLLRAVALRARGLAVAVIVGAPEDAATQALAHRARRVLRPEDAVVVVAPGQDNLPGLSETWLAGRTAIDDRATAYLCRGTMCSLPIHEPQDLIDDGIPGA